MAILDTKDEEKLKKEYGDIFGGLLTSSVTPVASSEYTTEWYRPGSEKFKREAAAAVVREDPSGIAVLPSPLDSDYTRLRKEFMKGEPSVIEKSMPMMREDVSPYIDADRMLGPVSLETPLEAIPEVDTFDELKVALEAIPEVDASRDPRWKAFDDEVARLKESGYKWPGPLTPLPWDGKTPRGPEYFEWLHSPRIEAVIKYGSDDDKRAHAKLGHKIPGYTYESATSATATGRVDDPDYERLVREALPEVDTFKELSEVGKSPAVGTREQAKTAGLDAASAHMRAFNAKYADDIGILWGDAKNVAPTYAAAVAENERRYKLREEAQAEALRLAAAPLDAYDLRIAEIAEADAKRAIPTLDERLDVPDVRTYTGDTGEVVTEDSPSLIADILAAREGKASGEYAERISEADKLLETEGTPWVAPISPIHDLDSLFEHDLAVATGKKTIVAGGHAKSETSRIIEDADYSREDIAAALRATGHTMTPEEFLEDHFMKSKATFGDSYIADLAKTAKKGVTSLADFFKDDAPGTEVTDRAREILSDFKWKSSLPTTLLGSDADSSLPMVGMAGAVVPAIDFIKKYGPLLASTHGELPARYLDISPVDASFRAGGLAKYALGAGSLGGGLMAHSTPLGVGSDVPLAPYTDPYPGMVDPTFAPDASIHYTDPLKHYDTETVPGHLPLSLNTPYTTAVEGFEHAAEFAPPEWSYPAMPTPSDYSRPDMGPIPSVDDFSSMPIPYVPGVYDPETGATNYITYAPWSAPPNYDWRTGAFTGGAGGGGGSISAASISDEDRLAAALERLASIPAGFVGGPEREIIYTDATGGRITPFGGVGDIGGGSGTITSPLTGRGGFYAPIGMPSPVYSYTDPGLSTGMGGFGGLWT